VASVVALLTKHSVEKVLANGAAFGVCNWNELIGKYRNRYEFVKDNIDVTKLFDS
jgi:hypothetical protein